MKRIQISVWILVLLFAFVSCDRSVEPVTEVIDETDSVATVFTEAERTLIGRAGALTREILDVPTSEKYMLRAAILSEKPSGSAKIGLCAGTNAHGQTLDFFGNAGGELVSHSTMYGNEIRADLGMIKTAATLPKTETSMTVIRDGDLFYLIEGGILCQIREFDCDATAPGFAVSLATVQYKDIEYTDDPAAIDAAIAEYMLQYKGYGIGDGHANFRGITFHDEGSFTLDESFLKKSPDYSRIAFADSYTGDMEITFKTKELKALTSADNSGDTMCRLRFLLYSENDVVDMICLGVANKQDRIETFSTYDIAQWYNHIDLTGARNTYFDWEAENEIRILLTNTGKSNTYSVYVNGDLFAVRTSLAMGPVQFGFEAENVCGTVSGFKVIGGRGISETKFQKSGMRACLRLGSLHIGRLLSKYSRRLYAHTRKARGSHICGKNGHASRTCCQGCRRRRRQRFRARRGSVSRRIGLYSRASVFAESDLYRTYRRKILRGIYCA